MSERESDRTLLAAFTGEGTAGVITAFNRYNSSIVRNADGDYTLTIGAPGTTDGGVEGNHMQVDVNCMASPRICNVESVTSNTKRIRFTDAAGVLALPDDFQVYIYRNNKLGDG